MRKLILLPGEHIIEDRVKLYGATPDFIIRFIVGPCMVIAAIFVFTWMSRTFSNFANNPATANIGFYQALHRFYPLIIIVLAAVMLHFMAGLYFNRVILTNSAIVKQTLFSNYRINFEEMASVKSEREEFTSVMPARQRLHMLAGLLGITQIVTIRTQDNREMIIRYMSKECADELKEKLDAARSMVIARP